MEKVDLKEFDFNLFIGYYSEYDDWDYFVTYGSCPNYSTNLEKLEKIS